MENQSIPLSQHKSRLSNGSLKLEGNLMNSISYFNTSQAESTIKIKESKLESPDLDANRR